MAFGVLIAEGTKPAPDPELLAVSAILHDLGLTSRCHKEPEVVIKHSGIAVDVIGAGLDSIPQDKVRAILAEFPRLSMKKQFQDSLCGVVRQKPATSYDNILRDIGTRYVEGYTAPSEVALIENAPFSE